MAAFRLLLSTIFLLLLAYTAVVGIHHGWDLLSVFFGDMAAMTWPGQFNLDFMCLLLLSGLWVAWRHRFSAPGIGLGLLAIFGGALFLSAYLLVASLQAQGDINKLLLGIGRNSGNRVG